MRRFTRLIGLQGRSINTRPVLHLHQAVPHTVSD